MDFHYINEYIKKTRQPENIEQKFDPINFKLKAWATKNSHIFYINRPLPVLKKSGAPAELGIEEEEVLIDPAWPHL
jgi:hypothetical protein